MSMHAKQILWAIALAIVPPLLQEDIVRFSESAVSRTDIDADAEEVLYGCCILVVAAGMW